LRLVPRVINETSVGPSLLTLSARLS